MLKKAAIHPWETAVPGAMSAESLTAWVEERLAAHRREIKDLLAVTDKRNTENTLRHFDRAFAELNSAGSQSGVLNSVHPQKEIRDTAEAMTQKIVGGRHGALAESGSISRHCARWM